MEKAYKKLTKEDAIALLPNNLVYITLLSNEDIKRIPAFVIKNNGKAMAVFLNNPFKHSLVSFSRYDEDWFVEVENGFIVETPAGILHAWDKGDSMYPGIWIDLYPTGNLEDNCISLSMTEYTPGGEGLCGWDPSRPWLSQDEIDEVPVERIVDKDGNPITDKSGVTIGSGHVTVAGLVTRTWPNEMDDPDYHKRTFHVLGNEKEMQV